MDRALADLGVPPPTSPLAALLAWLRGQPAAPPVKALELQWTSQRAFYRAWRREIPENAAKFLKRVRQHHIEALMEAGLSYVDAEHAAAGYRLPRRRARELRRRLREEEAQRRSLEEAQRKDARE